MVGRAAVLVAAYGLGAYGSRTMRQVTRLLAAAGLAAALVALQAGGGNHSAAVACALLATALVLGEVTSSHRDTAIAAARHAHDLDRASLARELHDVLAHQLSAIAVRPARPGSPHPPTRWPQCGPSAPSSGKPGPG